MLPFWFLEPRYATNHPQTHIVHMVDEDILANESSNGSTGPSQAPKTQIQGPIT
jgi:hypothetical protein